MIIQVCYEKKSLILTIIPRTPPGRLVSMSNRNVCKKKNAFVQCKVVATGDSMWLV